MFLKTQKDLCIHNDIFMISCLYFNPFILHFFPLSLSSFSHNSQSNQLIFQALLDAKQECQDLDSDSWEQEVQLTATGRENATVHDVSIFSDILGTMWAAHHVATRWQVHSYP